MVPSHCSIGAFSVLDWVLTFDAIHDLPDAVRAPSETVSLFLECEYSSQMAYLIPYPKVPHECKNNRQNQPPPENL